MHGIEGTKVTAKGIDTLFIETENYTYTLFIETENYLYPIY